MELVDTHCHLFAEPLRGQLAGVLARARGAGVTRVIVPAYDRASWTAVLALADGTDRSAEGGPKVYGAIGVHPWVAAEQSLDAAELARALASSGIVALGEVGLDFVVPGADRARQLALLELQLDVALSLDLPVILHCRAAFEELAALLARYDGRLRGVLHAFSRGPELARRFVELGLHLGLGGAVTRPRARRVQRAVAHVPLERLVLETDAPYIGLEGVPPAETEPCHVACVAEALAQLLPLSSGQLARQTSETARALFRLS